jgi:hypothetical protein
VRIRAGTESSGADADSTTDPLATEDVEPDGTAHTDPEVWRPEPPFPNTARFETVLEGANADELRVQSPRIAAPRPCHGSFALLADLWEAGAVRRAVEHRDRAEEWL